MKKALFIIGPAGVGKTTLCGTLQESLSHHGINAHIFNLDPATKDPIKDLDIRRQFDFEEIMLRFQLGPNGTLMYIMDRVMQDTGNFREVLGEFDDDFLLVDCPGQIEAYIHSDGFIQKATAAFDAMGYSVSVLYVLDTTFLLDSRKMLMGLVVCTCVSLHIQTPLVTVVSKLDLLPEDTDVQGIVDGISEVDDGVGSGKKVGMLEKLKGVLNNAGCSPIVCLDRTDRDSMDELLHTIMGMDLEENMRLDGDKEDD